MARKKLLRFADNRTNTRIIQAGHPFYEGDKRDWAAFFGNLKPLVLELGCGRGEYSVGLAERFKDFNYIGVDIKGDRLWHGAKLAADLALENVTFLRIKVQDIDDFFGAQSVSQIWIPFPDPRPKKKDRGRRLTHHRFLELYRQLLTEGGCLHFKTDDLNLFDFTLEELEKFKVRNLEYTYDYHQSPLSAQPAPILTKYEQAFLQHGKTIKYLRVRF